MIAQACVGSAVVSVYDVKSRFRRLYTTAVNNVNMATYDSLHRQARTLEFLLDSKLTAYSRIVSSVTKDGNDVESRGSADRWQDHEAEVEDLLEKVDQFTTRPVSF